MFFDMLILNSNLNGYYRHEDEGHRLYPESKCRKIGGLSEKIEIRFRSKVPRLMAMCSW